jgi:CubicO group peptidase (beta-lactamase class C family)
VAPRLIPANATQGAAAITMEDLVTLRAGLESTSGANYGGWVQSPNWVAYALRRPMIDVPGGRMIYSTGSSHVLGAAVATASGKSLLTLARERLGAPLGIEVPAWRRDPQGFYFGGNEMTLTPRAMLRLAVMMRDKGRFGGTPVITLVLKRIRLRHRPWLWRPDHRGAPGAQAGSGDHLGPGPAGAVGRLFR